MRTLSDCTDADLKKSIQSFLKSFGLEKSDWDHFCREKGGLTALIKKAKPKLYREQASV